MSRCLSACHSYGVQHVNFYLATPPHAKRITLVRPRTRTDGTRAFQAFFFNYSNHTSIQRPELLLKRTVCLRIQSSKQQGANGLISAFAISSQRRSSVAALAIILVMVAVLVYFQPTKVESKR